MSDDQMKPTTAADIAETSDEIPTPLAGGNIGGVSNSSNSQDHRPMPWIIPAGIAGMLVTAAIIADKCNTEPVAERDGVEYTTFPETDVDSIAGVFGGATPSAPSVKPLSDYERGFADGVETLAGEICGPAARFDHVHSIDYFEVNSFQIGPEARYHLDMAACILRNHLQEDGQIAEGGTLVLSGGTSSDGSEALNVNLSWQRAQAVSMYLRDDPELRGVRMELRGYGEDPAHRNIQDDGPEDSAHYNRNVKFSIEYAR